MTKDPKTLTDPSRRDALRVMAAGTAGGLFAANLLGQPAHGQTKPAAPKGRIVVGVTQEPTVFNPLMPHLEVDDSVAFSVFDALFRIDPKGVIVPNLAAEVPTQANGGISADGLKWRIRLRDNVRWHDGDPLHCRGREVHAGTDRQPQVPRLAHHRPCAGARHHAWSRRPKSPGGWSSPSRPICRT